MCAPDSSSPDGPCVSAGTPLSTGPGQTRAPGCRGVVVERTGSTNDDLRHALTGSDGLLDREAARCWPHLSWLRAEQQTAGRGRGGHVWTTPRRGALTMSFVLRPLVPLERLGWLPLLAGLALRDGLSEGGDLTGCGWQVATKWPNDVVLVPLIGSGGPGYAVGAAAEAAFAGLEPPAPPVVPGWGRARKVAGVLTELILPGKGREPGPRTEPGPSLTSPGHGQPDARDLAPAVVLGIGVNVGQEARDLPVPWATSLAVAGWDVGVEEVAARLARHLERVLTSWEAADGDPDLRPAGQETLGDRLRGACWTLGRQVRVRTPAGAQQGRAVDLRPGLVLAGAGVDVVVHAGDVEELRDEETE
ncbi:biotin--[acetyl-CoA-carboxylase] ligase [Actinomyces faecalis]|uniref:biotin--[acetyl-CoA-carboxylase] ligase n=1 Tax=Actinomyces faecalis TaxID=2722820 RepID=UPI001FD238FD|nr:biotin--[acetyl-CoA-carboxylase] ligase [Actinomyces faecalis]